jgi:hypothetical protein
MVTKITFERKNGSQYYTTNPEHIEAIVSAVNQLNIDYKHTTTIDTLRNKYFSMIKEIIRNTSLGYNATELHESLKPILFNHFIEYPHYFIGGEFKQSLTALNIDGYSALIEELKIAAVDLFNYVFEK